MSFNNKTKRCFPNFSTIDVSEFQFGLNIEQARIFFAEKNGKPFRFDYTPTTDGSHFHIPAWSQHNRSKLPNALILKSALNRYGCRCYCHRWIKVWSTSLIWRGSRSIAGNFNKAPSVTCEFSTIIGRTFHFNAHPACVCVCVTPKNCSHCTQPICERRVSAFPGPQLLMMFFSDPVKRSFTLTAPPRNVLPYSWEMQRIGGHRKKTYKIPTQHKGRKHCAE